MKLIHANCCSDVFSLRYESRTCVCGRSGGNYLEDGLHAIIWGDCVALGFENYSFTKALRTQPFSGRGREYTAFVIPIQCETVEHLQPSIEAEQGKEATSELIKEIVAEIKDKQSSADPDIAWGSDEIDVHGVDNE